jgi:uncharacterized membrane protein
MNDERLELIVGNLLRAGVVLSALVVAAGAVWYLAASGSTPVAYHQFHPGPAGLHSLEALPGPLKVIEIGLLLLIFTPVARVGFALVAFYLERDHVYVGVTLAVLLVLLYSIGSAWL